MADCTSDGLADRLSDGVGEADEAKVAGEGGDDFLTVVGRPFRMTERKTSTSSSGS